MRHHYVPEFLQKPWASSNRDKKLEVFSLTKPGLPSDRHTPKYTGYEKDLYALTREVVAGMEKQAVETEFLKHVDNFAATSRDKLLESEKINQFTSEDRNNWVRFLMSLRLRQPRSVNELRLKAETHLRSAFSSQPEIYKELAGSDDPPSLAEWSEKYFPGLIENFGMSAFHKLVDNPNIGDKILGMTWLVLDFSHVKFDLLLSDNPAIFTHGIDDPLFLLALPISPSKAFFATDNAEILHLLRNESPQRLAMRLNESSVGQAEEMVYAKNDSPRRFIINRLRQSERLIVRKYE